ncbi:MAG TPA: hypothetical protein PKW80_02860 [Bacteroidales bacterium]|nr:hypothetical protein [Bacteroidales bacterium]
MKNIKHIPLYLLLFALVSCGNPKLNSENSEDGNEGNGTDDKLNFELPASLSNDVLEKAKNDGKPIFLVITGTGATGINEAIKNVTDANRNLSKSLVYSLDKDNSANNELVNRFGIATIPVPFILVISSKGIAVAGGTPTQMTAEQIIKSIPSPKQDEVYMALSEKRPVFIVVSKKNYTDKENILAVCKNASNKNNMKPAIVEIDFDDQNEKAFLGQIGITSINGTTITAVANAAGQITGTFPGMPTTNQLNAAANKVQQSGGCCPGGSSKGCG